MAPLHTMRAYSAMQHTSQSSHPLAHDGSGLAEENKNSDPAPEPTLIRKKTNYK